MTEQRKQEALDRLSKNYVTNLSKAIRHRMRVELEILEEHRTREEKKMNNRENILRMAQEAGWEMPNQWDSKDGFLIRLERFHAIAVAEKDKEIERLRDELEQRFNQFRAVSEVREKQLKAELEAQISRCYRLGMELSATKQALGAMRALFRLSTGLEYACHSTNTWGQKPEPPHSVPTDTTIDWVEQLEGEKAQQETPR